MDLKGLDSQWRGFSDFDIQRVKSKPLPSPSSNEEGRSPVKLSPSSSSVHPHQVPEKPPQSSPPPDDDSASITIATISASKEDEGTEKEVTPPNNQDVQDQQSKAVLTQQKDSPAEAELSEKSVSPARIKYPLPHSGMATF